ncbi:hypothetical protein SSX86_029593 [Deinandra increscens subsp. villosa]|uniref:C2H2-type domain-containing protein n=1 Tax=Deinandra increscens subsp. villosa TaxID=3103831 RepID=A0AAP0GK94_9ASTR
MWNAKSMSVDAQEEDESWEVKAFAEDTGNVNGTTWPPRFYTCTFCRREFRSAQALGGHMNVHRRDRARLHQAQPNFKTPNTSSSSSNLMFPSEKLVGDSGLCVLFSLPKPNAIFKPSSLNSFVNGSPSHLHSITPHPNTRGNFMNFPPAVAPHSLNYSLSNSSKNEALDHRSNQRVSRDNVIKKTDLSVEGIDLELRLGCSSSAS